MFKFNKSFATVGMAVACIATFAQDANQSHLFSQESSVTSATTDGVDALGGLLS